MDKASDPPTEKCFSYCSLLLLVGVPLIMFVVFNEALTFNEDQTSASVSVFNAGHVSIRGHRAQYKTNITQLQTSNIQLKADLDALTNKQNALMKKYEEDNEGEGFHLSPSPTTHCNVSATTTMKVAPLQQEIGNLLAENQRLREKLSKSIRAETYQGVDPTDKNVTRLQLAQALTWTRKENVLLANMNNQQTTTTASPGKTAPSSPPPSREYQVSKQCAYTKSMYANPVSQKFTAVNHDRNKDRILVISMHGGPHSDTIGDLLEMGWPPESLYSICTEQNCDLLGYDGGLPTGFGADYWSKKRIAGTQLHSKLSKVTQAMKTLLAWDNEAEQRLAEAAVVNANRKDWTLGKFQQDFDATVGNSLDSFTAVVCPYVGWRCAPFLDDKYSHLKVITRSSHRFYHSTIATPDRGKFMLAMLQHMADNPKRFLVSAANAFDYMELKTVATGRSGDTSDAGNYSPVENLNVVFWPGYYRHVREWSPTHPAVTSTTKATVVGIGEKYRSIFKTTFANFKQSLNGHQHNWQLATVADHLHKGATKITHRTRSLIDLAIVFPYSTHSAKMNEMYSLGIPMILPSLKLLMSMGTSPKDVLPHFDMSNSFLTHVEPFKSCGDQKSNIPEQWVAWADSYTLPHLFYFDSYENLANIIDSIVATKGLLDSTRVKMTRFWDNNYAGTSVAVSSYLDSLMEESAPATQHSKPKFTQKSDPATQHSKPKFTQKSDPTNAMRWALPMLRLDQSSARKHFDSLDPLNILVLGGSETAGVACIENENIHGRDCAWANRLGKIFQKWMPERSIQVHNFARGGTHTKIGLGTLSVLTEPFEKSNTTPDIVFTDYCINDVYDTDSAKVAMTYAAELEALIVGIQTLFPGTMHVVLWQSCTKCLNSYSTEKYELTKAVVARHQHASMIDFRSMSEIGKLKKWSKGDDHQFGDDRHPNWQTHQFIAETIAYGFQHAYQTELTNIFSLKELPPSCLHSLSRFSVTTKVDKNTHPEWEVIEDRPGKPGWITSTVGATLRYKMRFGPQPVLSVIYLRSYDTVGDAIIEVNGMSARLKARWDNANKRISVEYLTWFRAEMKNQQDLEGKVKLGDIGMTGFNLSPNTEYEIKIKFVGDNGTKFKLIELVSC